MRQKHIHPADLIPLDTRIVLAKETMKELLKEKNEVMLKLKVHRNTVNAWIRGEYNPSVKQLSMLGFDTKENWNSIKSIHLEGGRKTFIIPESLPINELSWLLGMLDGDGRIVTNHRIVIYNQDKALIEKSIEICKKLGIDENNMKKEISKEYSTSFKQNKPVIRLTINSRIISELMSNFRILLFNEVRGGNIIPFRLYVTGLTDSDGGFVRNNICINQKATAKGYEKLHLVKKILDGLGIQNGGIKGPDSKSMLRVYIYSNKNNLQKYHKHIGFISKHKSEKLNLLVS